MQKIKSLVLSPEALLDVATNLLDSPKPNEDMIKAMKNFKNPKSQIKANNDDEVERVADAVDQGNFRPATMRESMAVRLAA